jgi:hypothetical protein
MATIGGCIDNAHNKLLDPSGGGVFRIMIGPAMVEGNRAAASTQSLGGNPVIAKNRVE